MDRRHFITGGIAAASMVAMPKILRAEGSKNMKVLLINGSPHKEGCTYTALKEVADTLEKNGIATEIYYLGMKPISLTASSNTHLPECLQCIQAGDHRRGCTEAS